MEAAAEKSRSATVLDLQTWAYYNCTRLPTGGTYYPIPTNSECLIGISDAFSAFCLRVSVIFPTCSLYSQLKRSYSALHRWLFEVLLNVHRNRRFIRDGSTGYPPRLSHSSWALIGYASFLPVLLNVLECPTYLIGELFFGSVRAVSLAEKSLTAFRVSSTQTFATGLSTWTSDCVICTQTNYPKVK